MTRDGLVEVNAATGEETRISQRGKDFNIQKGKMPGQEALAPVLVKQEKAHRGPSPLLKDTGFVKNTERILGPEPLADRNKLPEHPQSPLSPQFAQGGADHQTPEQAEENRLQTEHKTGDPFGFRYGLRTGKDRSNPAGPADKAVPQKGTAYYQRFTQDAALPPDGQSSPQTDGTGVQSGISPPVPTPQEVSVPNPAALPGKSSGGDSKPGKLRFAQEEQVHAGEKLSKAQRKAEKTADKLEKARNKLPEQKKLRVSKDLDEKNRKQKYKIRFEAEAKTRQTHLKGTLPLRPVRAGANFTVGYAHNKMFQMEQENVGTQAAHKGELLAEGGLRTAYRLHKTAPYRRVAKLEQRSAKHNARLANQKLLNENPRLRSNPLSRLMQKHKIKRQYAKALRESRKTAQLAKQAEALGGKLLKLTASFIRSHPMVIGVAALLLLVLFSFSTLFTSCTNMAAGGLSSVLLSSYTAEDTDIDDAELIYTEWETDMQMRIRNAQAEHPGYDEYRYNVDDISHNPFELLAYLSAKYQDFTFSAVKAELQRVFNGQYTLKFVSETEIRYCTETHTDPETGESYTVEVPYEWYILNINLTSQSFTDVITPGLSAEEQEMFNLYMQTKGNRQYTASPFDFDWIPYVTGYYGWRIHPTTGEKDYHKGIDISVPTGTDILAGHDGKIIQAAYDAGGYGYYIAIEGKDGLVSKYAHCDRLLAGVGQQVKKGDVIAKSGNTGHSTGPHLHLEVIKNGRYLNPLFFADSPGDSNGITGSNAPVIPDYSGEPMGDGSFAALLGEAQKHLGKPYMFGASGPDTFDCSGFVCYAINRSGLASVGRTTAQGLYNLCTPVSAENARPGDLIFFQKTYSTPSACSHVGIYIGNGKMIHAGNPVQYASINTRYWQEHFYGFARLP